jgi:hypothetical protein
VLKEGRGAGSFMATQPSLEGFAGVRRESCSARRVVDSQMVLVPVASVFAQPCCLRTYERGTCMGAEVHTGIGPMKKRLDVRYRCSGVACCWTR